MYRWVQISLLLPLLIPNKNGIFSDLWCCFFPSLAPSLYSLSLLPCQGGRQYNFIRYIGVGRMLRWDFCFFILLVREAERTHIDGWVKWSRILLNNLQPWMRKMRYRMPNVSLTSMKIDMKTSKPLCRRKLRGPHANPQLQWEGWPWQPVGQQVSHSPLLVWPEGKGCAWCMKEKQSMFDEFSVQCFPLISAEEVILT